MFLDYRYNIVWYFIPIIIIIIIIQIFTEEGLSQIILNMNVTYVSNSLYACNIPISRLIFTAFVSFCLCINPGSNNGLNLPPVTIFPYQNLPPIFEVLVVVREG